MQVIYVIKRAFNCLKHRSKQSLQSEFPHLNRNSNLFLNKKF